MSHGPSSTQFHGLLVAACILDILQALTTSLKNHYIAIQLAGLSMRWAQTSSIPRLQFYEYGVAAVKDMCDKD